MVRFIFTALFIIVSAPILQAKEPISINRVSPGYKETEVYKTVRSYFSKGEAEQRRYIVRTQEEHSEGFYFIAELEGSVTTLPEGSRLQLEVITPYSAEPRSYSFILPKHDKHTWEIHAGLTGSDWPDADARPLAWKLTLVDQAGTELSEFKSFLWE